MYAIGLIRALADRTTPHKLTVLVQSDEQDLDGIESTRVHLLKFPAKIFSSFCMPLRLGAVDCTAYHFL